MDGLLSKLTEFLGEGTEGVNKAYPIIREQYTLYSTLEVVSAFVGLLFILLTGYVVIKEMVGITVIMGNTRGTIRYGESIETVEKYLKIKNKLLIATGVVFVVLVGIMLYMDIAAADYLLLKKVLK